jgi:hypothetical protein
LDLILDKMDGLEQRVDKLEYANSSQGMPEWFRIWKDTEFKTEIQKEINVLRQEIDARFKLNNLK